MKQVWIPRIGTPDVLEVRDAPDPQVKEGEVLNEAEVKSFCEGQIAHFKIPWKVEIVDEFPLTITGKIQKFVMRDQMIAQET